MTNLWTLPIANVFKEPYWRCLMDAFPTAARRHVREKCGCGHGDPSPDRNHHFNTCPVAIGIYELITSHMPGISIAIIRKALRTTVPTADMRIHKDIWKLTSMAAYHALDAGRRWLWHQVHVQREMAGEAITARALAHAVDQFWTTLARMGQEPLPRRWQREAEVPHPFLGWDRETQEWRIGKHRAPSPVC